MTMRYRLTCWVDDLEISGESGGGPLRVEKRGATGALGQLFSRRFAVSDAHGALLFEVVNGNSGTYPRASLIIDGREALVLTAGGQYFNTIGTVRGTSCAFSGDPMSPAFSVEAGSGRVEVSAARGSGKTVYRFTVPDDIDDISVIASVATLAVFRSRLLPCVEPAPEEWA